MSYYENCCCTHHLYGPDSERAGGRGRDREGRQPLGGGLVSSTLPVLVHGGGLCGQQGAPRVSTPLVVKRASQHRHRPSAAVGCRIGGRPRPSRRRRRPDKCLHNIPGPRRPPSAPTQAGGCGRVRPGHGRATKGTAHIASPAPSRPAAAAPPPAGCLAREDTADGSASSAASARILPLAPCFRPGSSLPLARCRCCIAEQCSYAGPGRPGPISAIKRTCVVAVAAEPTAPHAAPALQGWPGRPGRGITDVASVSRFTASSSAGRGARTSPCPRRPRRSYCCSAVLRSASRLRGAPRARGGAGRGRLSRLPRETAGRAGSRVARLPGRHVGDAPCHPTAVGLSWRFVRTSHQSLLVVQYLNVFILM